MAGMNEKIKNEISEFEPPMLPGGVTEYYYSFLYKGFTIVVRIPIEQLRIPIDQVKTAIEEVKKAGSKNAGLDAEVSTYLDAKVIETKDGHKYLELRNRGYWKGEYKGDSSIVTLELKEAARVITNEEYSYHINQLPLEYLDLRRRW